MKYAVVRFNAQGAIAEIMAYSINQQEAIHFLEGQCDEDEHTTTVMPVNDEAIRTSGGRDLDLTYDPDFDVEEALRQAVGIGVDGGIDLIANNADADTLGDPKCPRIRSRAWRNGPGNMYVEFEDGRVFVVSIDVQPSRESHK